MTDERQLIAENIAYLRKSAKLTQAELAEKLNYSDKAVSKWERAESIPDVLVLRQIASLFLVSMDFFFEGHDLNGDVPKIEHERHKTHMAIITTVCIAVAAVALLLFLVLRFALPEAAWQWKVFVAAVPLIFLVFLILQALWGENRLYLFIAISGLLWSLFATVFVFLYDIPMGVSVGDMFWICIPIQVIILVWAFLILRKKK